MTTVEQARLILDPNKLKLPPRPRVESIEVEEMEDLEGKDALHVQVVLGEDTTDDELTGEFGLSLESAIHDALLAEGIGEFPYVSVAKPSELEWIADED